MFTAFDSLATRHRDAALLLARLFLSALFLIEAYIKLTNYAGAADYFEQINVPLPALALPLSIAFEVAAPVALIAGILTRPVAFLICLYCIATALLAHTNFGNGNELLHFFKNIAIAGGALSLAVTGSGALSLDARR